MCVTSINPWDFPNTLGYNYPQVDYLSKEIQEKIGMLIKILNSTDTSENGIKLRNKIYGHLTDLINKVFIE